MRKTVVLLSILVGLVFVVLIVVALLPGIATSDAMKPFVLQKVNQQLPGRLEVKQWSLGWFEGIRGSGIVYDNRGEDLLVRVAELKSSDGLLDLVLSGGNLGTIELIDPAVVVYIAAEPKPQGTGEAETPAPSPETKPADEKKATVPAVYGQIIIKGGSLLTVSGKGSEKPVARDMDLLLDVSDPKNPITYRFSVKSGDKSGKAAGEGTLTLSTDDPLNFGKIQSNSNLKIENWELKEVFSILANQPGIPSAEGRLNAEVSLTGSAAESLHLLSSLSMEKLKLQGGPLATDAPTIKGIALELDAAGGTDSVTLKNLTLRSSLANGSAKGTFDVKGRQSLSGKADVNLAEVFTQLPGTLQLQKGTRITKGRMALAADFEKTPDLTAFKGNARIDRLQGINNGKKMSWDKPVTVDAKGEMRPDGIRLENMSLRSAFLNADGRGDTRNMQLNLSADIAAALKELKKFIQVKQWNGKGKLKLNLSINEKSSDLAKAVMKLNADNFVLNRGRSRILAKQNIRADLSADMKLAENFEKSKLLQPTLNIKSSLTSGKITATSIEGNPTNKFPNAAGLDVDANINLQQVSALLRNLDMLTPQTQLGGQSTIKALASLKDGKLVLEEAKADTRNLVYRQEQKTIKEKRLLLTTKGRIDLNKNALHLAPVNIDGQAGKIRIPELKVADWTNAQKDMKIKGKANLALGKLTRGYGDFIQIPEKTQISGKGRLNFNVDFSNPKAQYLNLKGNLKPFKLVSEKLPTISEKRVILNADVTRSPDGKHLTIKSFNVNSNALSMTATGSLDQVGKNKVFKAKGTMAPDLALVSDYLKKSGKPSIDFKGRKATPFTIEMVSKGDRWDDPLKHLKFSGALHVASIKAFGLKLTPNDIPVRLAGAAAGAKLESPANGGQLSLQPAIDMKKQPYVISFTENLNILKEVQITKGLTEGLLARIHPMFKDAVKPEGMLDLHMQYFNWPLAEKVGKDASFAGSLRLNGVKLNSTPFLSRLLSLMRVNEREFILADQTIDFVAADGRLKCSPLTIDVGGSPLVLQGSVGFDKTLDYIAQVPITENMVGKDAFQFLQGVTVKVPIRGTISKPKIDETAVQEATGSLVQQAMQKNFQKGVQNLLQNLLKPKK